MPTGLSGSGSLKQIRSWDGSQTRAFEELCFQLRDPTPPGAELRKTGDPDAGVEWYWLLNDGAEVAWQAKFVFDTSGLLSQMRKSLKATAGKRPEPAAR